VEGLECSVTPEVAGSSPVAPALEVPAKGKFLLSLKAGKAPSESIVCCPRRETGRSDIAVVLPRHVSGTEQKSFQFGQRSITVVAASSVRAQDPARSRLDYGVFSNPRLIHVLSRRG
jgi:hypothetical protein